MPGKFTNIPVALTDGDSKLPFSGSLRSSNSPTFRRVGSRSNPTDFEDQNISSSEHRLAGRVTAQPGKDLLQHKKWSLELSPQRTASGGVPVSTSGDSASVVSTALPSAALRHDQKMEALGRLAAGIAHDFNNLLTVILGNASALRASADSRENHAEANRASSIEMAAQRGGRLAAQLLAFSKKQVLYPEIVSAYTTLSALHNLLSRAAGDRIQTKLTADHDLWTCRVDRGQLESAVLNLVTNARDAMPEGGKLTISCYNESIDVKQARRAEIRPGDYVRIDVKDTGTGIPVELRERVFEPFFTTKPIGQGSGLGLSQVYGFVGQSGGSVELTSVMSLGTTVSLLLPRAEADKAPITISPCDGPTILLVESDKNFSRSVADKLRSSGHRVLVARDQSDALGWITSNEPIHLLIADASLLAGRGSLAREFRCIRPELLLLFLTDLPVQDVVYAVGNLGRCEVLSRRCQPGDVLTVAAALLRHGIFSLEREELHSELRTYSGRSLTGPRSRAPLEQSIACHVRSPYPIPSLTRHSVRVGVLPFKAADTLGLNKFSIGLAEELTTALGRFRWMSCVSPSSIAALADDATVSSQRWDDLDLDFLLEGSFRQSGADIRITIRLINIRESSEVSWSKSFDSKLADVLSLQDKIAAETAAQVAPEVLIWEGDRAVSRPQVDPTSYGLMLQAIPGVYRLDQRGFRAAGPLLKQALELDPTNAAAHSWLAHWYLLLVGQGWAKNPTWATQRADELAQRAITLDPSDARGLTVAGHVKAFLHKEAEQGLRLHAKALHLNPNLALAWCYRGLAQSYAGQHTEAIKCIQHAQRLSPHDPHGFFFDTSMVMPLLLTGDHALAAQFGRRAREANPGLSSAYKGLISALGFLGLLEEAQALLGELSVLEPNFSIRDAVARSPLTRLEDLQHYAAGLRLAGCDEGTRPRRRWDGWRLILPPWWQARGLTIRKHTEE